MLFSFQLKQVLLRVVRTGLKPGSPDFEESALTTRPHCLSLTTVVTHNVVDKRTDNAEQLSIRELEHSTSRMFDANDISVFRIVSMGSLRSTTRRQRKRHKFCIFNEQKQ